MIIKKQLLLFVMMLLPMVAMADAVEIDGIYYNLITKGKVAEVTRNPNNYSGSVIIPDKITFEETEYMVTNIGLAAFEWSSALISIIIPNSVTTIGNEAFWACESLTTIKIPNSVTSIGQYAFSGCNGLESIDLPNGITSVSEGAFQNCTSLTSIIIPTNVTSIGYKAFIGCTSLASITIGNNVTSIGEYAFLGTGLTSISIPNSVVSIGGWAFSDCIGLTSITIPNNVKGIGGYAFRGCSSLTSIILGSGLQSLGYGTFASCPVLIDVYSYAEYAPFAPSDAFEGSYIEYVTLHVPAESIDVYKTATPWNNFKNIVAIDGETPERMKCETPTISYKNGQLNFACATEGVEFVSEITDSDIKKNYDATVTLTATYNISVYATKTEYDNSDVATATLCWIDKEPQTEGITDGVSQISSRTVLIQSEGGIISLQGVDDGTLVCVYTIDGVLAGSATSRNGGALLNTNLRPGTTAIVKVGEKRVKVVIK